MSETRVPQCQARLKSSERCTKRARFVVAGGGFDPQFVCGIHAQEGRLPSSFVGAEVDPTTLPDDYLHHLLWGWESREKELNRIASGALARWQSSKAKVRAVTAEIRSRQAQPAPAAVDASDSPLEAVS